MPKLSFKYQYIFIYIFTSLSLEVKFLEKNTCIQVATKPKFFFISNSSSKSEHKASDIHFTTNLFQSDTKNVHKL